MLYNQNQADSSRLANVLKTKLNKKLVEVKLEEAQNLNEKDKVNAIAMLFSKQRANEPVERNSQQMKRIWHDIIEMGAV